MGRRSHSRSLSIWTNGVRVARCTLPARGEMELHYDADWERCSQAAGVGRQLNQATFVDGDGHEKARSVALEALQFVQLRQRLAQAAAAQGVVHLPAELGAVRAARPAVEPPAAEQAGDADAVAAPHQRG